MSRMFTLLATIFAFWVIALPGPAEAAQRGADGIKNLDQYEFSDVRRQRRYVRRYYAPRYHYYRPYYQPYYRPYYYRPYGYYGASPLFPFLGW